MNERLRKQWELTESLLREAAEHIRSSSHFDSYSDFIDHNELELALDVLEEAGEECSVNSEYWHLLKKAAGVMGLDTRRKALQRKFQQARAAQN